MPRHPTDLLSLAFGLLFTAAGLVLLTGLGGAVSLAWLGPLVGIGLGVVLVLAARSAQRSPADEEPPDA